MKKKFMNQQHTYKAFTYLALIALVTTFGLASCKKDFLDRQPLGRYTSDNYPYPTGGGPYDQYVYAAYSALRDYYVTSYGFIGAVSIRSDDADKGSSLFDGSTYGLIAADNFPVFTDALFCNELWKGYYGSLIYKCNVVLREVAHDSSGTSDDVKSLATA
ncbi:MAG TPA: hypothetical protein VEV83_22860, partial [Parafilimonas sp.]|nr:hypothetical protein [Parafilimonas sp.]